MKAKAIPFFLFVGYILLSLCLPEFHPFSKYPMYSSFPNYAYAFYLQDENGRPVSPKVYFNISANELGHLYSSINERNGFAYGNGTESDAQLATVGREMLERIRSTPRNPLPFDSLALYRIYWHYAGDTLLKDEKQLYKTGPE